MMENKALDAHVLEAGSVVDLVDHERDIDSEDEMLAQHSLRRGVMEQRSVAKMAFQNAAAQESLPLDYGRIRGRLMMPTDLEKWSRDQKRLDSALKKVYQNETERLTELHKFVACGGAIAQKASFDEVIGSSQDQAIPGRDDSLELLMCLQKPMMEISRMNAAYSALEQHVEECNVLLETTTLDTKHELDKVARAQWTAEVLTTVPSREEFNAILTQPEREQLAIAPQDTALDVSGFNIRHTDWKQHLPQPALTPSTQIVSIVPQGTSIPIVTPEPSGNVDTWIATDIHEGVNSTQPTSAAKTSGYYSAEDDEMYEI